MTIRGPLLFASLLAAGGNGLAQTSSARVEISPFFGYLFGGTSNSVTIPNPISGDPLTLKYRVADHTAYGLRLGYNLSAHFEPEIEWTHVGTGLRSAGSYRVQEICLNTDCLKFDYFLGGMTYNVGNGRVRPYVSLLAGAARISPTFTLEDFEHRVGSDTRFSGAIGVGLKAFFSSSVGLRVDARGYATRTAGIGYGPVCTTFHDPGAPPTTDPCGPRNWLLNADLTGGLVLAF